MPRASLDGCTPGTRCRPASPRWPVGSRLQMDEEPAPRLVMDDESIPVHGESDPAAPSSGPSVQSTGPTQGHAALNGFVGGATKRFADEMAGKSYELGNYLRNLIH